MGEYGKIRRNQMHQDYDCWMYTLHFTSDIYHITDIEKHYTILTIKVPQREVFIFSLKHCYNRNKLYAYGEIILWGSAYGKREE